MRKLKYYIENFEHLTEEEIKQSHYLVLHKTHEQMNRYANLINEVNKQNGEIIEHNNQLADMIRLYRSFIKASGLSKQFELYSKKVVT